MTNPQKIGRKFGKKWPVGVLILYLLLAGGIAGETIIHETAARHYFDQALEINNLKNNASQFLTHFDKESPILGMLFSPSIAHALVLPTKEESAHELEVVIPHLQKLEKKEAAEAEGWSWALCIFSGVYLLILLLVRSRVPASQIILAFVAVSLVCFVVGILAPAMVIWTLPSIPLANTKLEFVLQHQVRSISSVISGLITSGHWIVGSLIFLFSIITPMIKAVLTCLAAFTERIVLKNNLSKILHVIGKWSMADVFVAGVLLSFFSLQAQEATKVVPCLGMYYFIGYCLLSMVASSLLSTGESAPVARLPRAKTETVQVVSETAK